MKVGLELHMQLNTGKLFCRCPNIIKRDEEPDYIIKRKLHAVAGETGEVDIAAKAEESKNQIIKYYCYKDNVCLVDLDEEPPREINNDALRAALEIALLLNMKPVDEFHIMRKLIIDGSAVSGFQRTGLLATNGYINSPYGKVRIATLCLEEDSARRVDDSTFSLDRLGIPLVEIATEPDISNPQQARDVAEKLGMLCKFTGKLMRGIGTIRQDVNVSIDGGARVEIKGVQELRMMPKFVELEVVRQENLLRLRDEFKKRNVKLDKKVVDLTELFKSTKSSIFQGKNVFGIKLANGIGLLGFKLQLNKSFGKEIAERLKVYAGIKGIIHRDELPNYGITQLEVDSVASALKCKKDDNFILFTSSEDKVDLIYNVISDRIKQVFEGVPEEVRAPNHLDGTTSFMRPMPGKARMYPETDVPTIRITQEMISGIIDNLSKTPDEVYSWLKSLGLNDELSNQMLHSDYIELFSKVVDASIISPKLAASILLNTELPKLEQKDVIYLFTLLGKGRLSKEAIPLIVEKVLSGSKIESVVKEYKVLSTKELMKKVKDEISKNKKLIGTNACFGVMMKNLMTELRGKVDAGLLSKVLREELSKYDSDN